VPDAAVPRSSVDACGQGVVAPQCPAVYAEGNDMIRYEVVLGSQSEHCCFEYTVVDKTKPVMINGNHFNNQFETMCECFDKESADIICSGLNLGDTLA
jgi:hypothetical protein